MKNNHLNVAEIFRSIDGEVNHFYQGRQTVFLRLAGCNLKCRYCDTNKFQFESSGTMISFDDLYHMLNKLGGENLTITGGEPLLQKEELEKFLYGPIGFKNISIETNGSLDIPYWNCFDDRHILFVVDCKLTDPEFGLMKRSNFQNPMYSNNFIKMVIVSDQCMERAIEVYRMIRSMNKHINIAISPAFSDPVQYAKNAKNIINRLEKEGIYDCILNLQLHKLIDMQ